jgi:cystathionine beta-lyase
MIRFNGREVVEVPMQLNDAGRYGFSRENLEAALKGAGERGLAVPLALFCSPHTPGGTVWEREELELFLGFARDHAITVVSDEIHRDFVYPPKTFTSIMAFPEYADRTIGISGANKSFNLGGLPLSHFMVRDQKLAHSLQNGLRAFGGASGIFALIATETAYRSCGNELDELLVYIQANLEAAVVMTNNEIPGVRAYKPEGTYLIWADASELIAKLGLRDDIELAVRLEQESRVKCTPGSAFGSRGRGFLRINAACSRAQLMEGLERIKRFAFHD